MMRKSQIERIPARTPVLIAEDDEISRRLLCSLLEKRGLSMIEAHDGLQTWKALQKPERPSMVILDWMMPGIDGIELCRKIRSEIPVPYIYIILVTSRNSTDDIALGLDAGADDYIIKPFHARELYARVEVGMRILGLQNRLESQVRKLEDALSKVRQLQGLLPICSYCHRVRNDTNYWEKVEQYITEHTDARVSHSICPDCYESMIRPQLDAIRKRVPKP